MPLITSGAVSSQVALTHRRRSSFPSLIIVCLIMLIFAAISAIPIILTVLQFKEKSHTRYVALALAILYVALSFASEHTRNREQNRILTRIIWQDTSASVTLQNNALTVPAESISAQFNIFSPGDIHLPPHSGISLRDIRRACITDSQSGLEYLPEHDAEKLFHAFAQPDGSTSFNTERKAGIEPLLYSGDRTIIAPLNIAIVQLRREIGPTPQSKFASLYDLNGTIIIGYVQALLSHPVISSLNIKLASSAGTRSIDMPINLAERGSGFATIRSRYVGICIPDDYFNAIAPDS